MNNPTGSQTKALRSDAAENNTVERTSAFLRPILSEIQPPITAPINLPKKVAAVSTLTVEIVSPQLVSIAGVANENVLTSPNSKKNTNARSHAIPHFFKSQQQTSQPAICEATFSLVRP